LEHRALLGLKLVVGGKSVFEIDVQVGPGDTGMVAGQMECRQRPAGTSTNIESARRARASMPSPVGLIPATPHPRIIAVDLDDTLNNFSETLRQGEFPYDAADSLSKETFEQYLQLIRSGESEPGNLMSTGFNYCRFKIHLRCWQEARPRPDGVEFMHWLRRHHWRIVICTRRDMRRAYDCTRDWLQQHNIPFDDLFMTANKIAFCAAWGIRYLVDDSSFNIIHGSAYNIDVYYPILPHHQSLPPNNARGFQTFEEVRRWIQE
jgi:hypothetical protein